tara:strand:+ start:84 stop:596 length:513 start_codon:yes stop_codon:yes gene_type:complete
MKKLYIILFSFLIATTNVYSAGGSGGDSGGSGGDGADNKQSMFKSATNYVKAGKKLEKKGKLEKAKTKYEKAFKRLLKANDKDPSNPDVLNYLGFTSRKLGNFADAEDYYMEGLKINPNHNGINEYLGELYLSTNRPEKAKERLLVLKNCNCEEYEELKALINGTKESKY